MLTVLGFFGKGMKILTSLLGIDKTVAQAQIVSEGFTVGTVTQIDSSDAAELSNHNKVISQLPVASSLLDYDSSIDITWRNFSFTPYSFTPYAFTPGPYSFTPFAFTPYTFTPYSFTPYAFTPYAFTPYSFTPYAFTPSSTTGTIPNVVGLSVNLALAIISEEGFQNAPIQQNSGVGATAQNHQQVKSQNPAAGTIAPFYTNVQLVLYYYNPDAYSFTPYSFTPVYSFTPYSFTPYSFTPAGGGFTGCRGVKPYPYCVCQSNTPGTQWVC